MSPHPGAALAAAVPHRHPLLLVDRLDRLAPGRDGSAWKAVSANEALAEEAGARGLSEALLVDALGQLAITVLASAAPDTSNHDAAPAPRVYYLAEIEHMEFAGRARPGDLLRMQATVGRVWGRVSRVDVRADVEGRRVAAGTLVLSRADARRPRVGAGGRSSR